MSYYRSYQPVPKERMKPAEGVPHQKYEGGKGAQAYLVYTWHDPSKGYYLLAYGGKRRKPDVFYRYRNEEQRDRACEDRLAAYRERVERAEREKALTNPLKVGDLLCCSWGYDQTNVDFYQVVKATKRSVQLRKVGGERVEGSDGFMSCKVRPVKDKFYSEPMSKRVRVYMDGDKVCCSVSMTSYANAYPCKEGSEHYCSWYH